jgi:hypothetical protein
VADEPFHGDKSTTEPYKKSKKVLGSELSTDATPEAVTIGNVTYLIPRNYISNHYLSELKVTYPDFKPYTDETKDRFDAKIAFQTGCQTVEFNLNPSPYREKEMAANAHRDSPDLHCREHAGPLGYMIYSIGQNEALSEAYVNDAAGIFFECVGSGDNREICQDHFSLADNNSAHFIFLLTKEHKMQVDMNDVPAIEAGIRKLVASFSDSATK